MNWLEWFWLALLVVFLLAEASTVTMVSLWFAAGALAALVVSLLGAGIWLQVGAFFVVSATMLVLLRPIARKFFTPKLVKTNVDSVVGQKGVVTVAIDNIKAQGQVKLDAMVWTARSASGEPIPEGSVVCVEKIEGVKVFVTPVEVLETVRS